MRRRALLKCLASLPFVGVATTAFAKDKVALNRQYGAVKSSENLYKITFDNFTQYQNTMIRTLAYNPSFENRIVRRTFGEGKYNIFVENLYPSSSYTALPQRILYGASYILDMGTNTVIKDRYRS